MKEEIYCEALANEVGQKIEFRENIEGIDEWPKNFPPGEISYRLNNFSEDMSKKWQIKAVTIALRVWQWRIQKLKFRRERNPDVHVDANVEWHDLSHFGGRKSVFAHAYFPGQSDISGDVHLNDYWAYVAASKFQDLAHPPLVPIMIHEFGHSLIGLRHDPIYQESMMYPSFNLGRKKWKLHFRDISRAQDRHGARTINQRIIDYFIRRRLLAGDFR